MSAALDINNAGQVVGQSNTLGNTGYHATLWNRSTVIDLNTFLDSSLVEEGWILENANAINDNGSIVGTASNLLTGVSHAFLMSVTAVPEPESYAMLLVGTGLICVVIKRRARRRAIFKPSPRWRDSLTLQ